MSPTTTTPSFTLHEPSPSHPPKIPFGRGGAGNRTSHPTTATLSPHAAPTTISKSTPYAHSQYSTSSSSSSSSKSQNSVPHYSTGRGGAGNMYPAGEERRVFSFDEELAVEGKVGGAPVFHVGRGGRGNLVVREWLGRGRKV